MVVIPATVRELTGVLNYSGSSSFYINQGTKTDTLLYGNHVCFGGTSGAIQTAANVVFPFPTLIENAELLFGPLKYKLLVVL